MNEEFPFTEITRADIDKVLENLLEKSEDECEFTYCISCHEKTPIILTDYYTAQCIDCFSLKKPFLQSSPVRNAYFSFENEE
jgi:hypothetical protein